LGERGDSTALDAPDADEPRERAESGAGRSAGSEGRSRPDERSAEVDAEGV